MRIAPNQNYCAEESLFCVRVLIRSVSARDIVADAHNSFWFSILVISHCASTAQPDVSPIFVAEPQLMFNEIPRQDPIVDRIANATHVIGIHYFEERRSGLRKIGILGPVPQRFSHWRRAFHPVGGHVPIPNACRGTKTLHHRLMTGTHFLKCSIGFFAKGDISHDDQPIGVLLLVIGDR